MDSNKRWRKSQSFPIFLVLFLGYIGYSIVLPIFAPMLFDPNHGLLPSYHKESTRSIILGTLIAMYPLGQIIGCPLLGKLSDIHGRRKVLLISLGLIIPGYVLSGLAISTNHLSLLFISRFLIGLCEGNIVIATASIADISNTHLNKVKNFGWITTISSSGFVIGPLLGGKLADSKIISWCSYATPFYLSAVVVVIALICVYYLFEETKPPQRHLPFSPMRELKGMYHALTYKELQPVFFGNFNLYMSFFFFFAFLPVILVRQYNFGASLLAEAEAYLSLCICITPIFYRKLSKYLASNQVAALSGFLFFIGEVILLFVTTPQSLVVTLLLPSVCIAAGFTYSSLMISDRASKDKQGEALGSNQSILVLAECLSGLLGGVLAGVFLKLPIIISAIMALVCGFWMTFKVQSEIIND
ncbi:MAG: MFS transporter [Chlamydiales bacterium]|nr:MFS transporter [Chlamydiales bacterium]